MKALYPLLQLFKDIRAFQTAKLRKIFMFHNIIFVEILNGIKYCTFMLLLQR